MLVGKVNVGKKFYFYFDGWAVVKHDKINNGEKELRKSSGSCNWAIEKSMEWIFSSFFGATGDEVKVLNLVLVNAKEGWIDEEFV